MMSEFSSQPMWVRASWGPRRETPEVLARRLGGCIAALGNAHELLSEWFYECRAEPSGWRQVFLADNALRDLLDEMKQLDDCGSRIEALGFYVPLWNRRTISVRLSARVGAYSESPGVGNSVSISLPPPDGPAGMLYEAETAIGIVRTLVESWEPEYVTWQNMAMFEAQKRAALYQPKDWTTLEPKVGWLTYLASSAVGSVDRVTECGGQNSGEGFLFRASETVQDLSLDAVLELKDRLDKAGVLPRS